MKHLTEQLIAFAAGHRIQVLSALILLGLLSGLNLFRINFTNDVSHLFPDSQDAGTTFRVLNETKLGNTVQLEFICPGSVEEHEKYLDAVAEKIARLPGVKNIVFRYRDSDIPGIMNSFTALLPRFLGPEILKKCDPEQAVRNALKQLAFPIPGSVSRIRDQPFGLERVIHLPLLRLDFLTGMDLSAELPYFASKDKRRAMMVFDADIVIGNATSVRKLLAGIRNAVEPMVQGMEYRVISGAMHTLGNEEVLKRDAAISGTISLLLFLSIFLIFYRRDWRALWIPVIPIYASLLALGIMHLFFREICLYVVGLGSCITGLAVDQGIHVYSACRGKNAVGRTAALTEPMLLSALTSIMVFVFLALTGIRAYIQLAVFAGLSLAFSCLIALTVLPLLVDRSRTIREFAFPLPGIPRIAAWKILLLILPAAWGLFILTDRADLSLESLDGTPESVRKQEKDFNAAWKWKNARQTSVLAVSGADREEVLKRMLEISRHLTEKKIFHAAPPLPPRSEQLVNRNRWRAPSVTEEIAALEKRTRETCRKHRLPEQFFQPFFTRLRTAVGSDDLSIPPILDAVMKKMVKEHPGGASAVALIEDQRDQMPEIRKILKQYGNGHCALLSKEYFRMMIRSELGGRFLWILPLSLFSALLLAYAVFRKISDVLLAMTPVFVSFCGLFILGALSGFRATPAAAFALILLTGLAIDYGIYAVSQLRHPETISARNSVFLSAATTVAGAGALVFSRHPALFGTGIVLAVGIVIACLSGLYIVPMLKWNGKAGKLFAAALSGLLLSGCTAKIPFAEYPEAQNLKQKMKIYPETPFQIQANAILEIQNREFSFLLAAELNPETGEVKAAGISGAGILLFRISGQDCISGSGLPGNTKKMFPAFREDLCRIFLLKDQTPLAVKQKAEYIVLSSDNSVKWEFHPDKIIRLKDSFLIRNWVGEYRDSGRTVRYCNHRGNYTLRLKIIKLTEKGKND